SPSRCTTSSRATSPIVLHRKRQNLYSPSYGLAFAYARIRASDTLRVVKRTEQCHSLNDTHFLSTPTSARAFRVRTTSRICSTYAGEASDSTCSGGRAQSKGRVEGISFRRHLRALHRRHGRLRRSVEPPQACYSGFLSPSGPAQTGARQAGHVLVHHPSAEPIDSVAARIRVHRGERPAGRAPPAPERHAGWVDPQYVSHARAGCGGIAARRGLVQSALQIIAADAEVHQRSARSPLPSQAVHSRPDRCDDPQAAGAA